LERDRRRYNIIANVFITPAVSRRCTIRSYGGRDKLDVRQQCKARHILFTVEGSRCCGRKHIMTLTSIRRLADASSSQSDAVVSVDPNVTRVTHTNTSFSTSRVPVSTDYVFDRRTATNYDWSRGRQVPVTVTVASCSPQHSMLCFLNKPCVSTPKMPVPKLHAVDEVGGHLMNARGLKCLAV